MNYYSVLLFVKNLYFILVITNVNSIWYYLRESQYHLICNLLWWSPTLNLSDITSENRNIT
jgi:hypothetical protein